MANTSKGFIWRQIDKSTGEIIEPPKKEKRNHRKVIDYIAGVIYESISEAARVNDVKMQTLHNQISGRNKNKTTFMYLDKYLEIKLDLNNGDF